MAQPETLIQQNIQRAIKARGGFVFKVHGNEYTMAGLPDLIVCYRGQFLGLEVKTATGKTSPMQDHRLKQIRQTGGVGTVVRSVKEAEEILDQVDRQIADRHESDVTPGPFLRVVDND